MTTETGPKVPLAPSVEELTRAAERERADHGDDPRRLLREAEARAKAGRAGEALAALAAAAESYKARGRHLEAISVLKHMLRQDKAPVELRAELARAYGRLGFAAESVCEWRELATLLEDEGRPLDALLGLEEAIEHAPHDAELRLAVAQRSLDLGRTKEACRELRWALAAGGEVAAGTALLALAERLLEEDPSLYDVACHVALVHLEAGRPERATPLLEQARAAHPDNLTVLGLFSRALRECGEQAGAAEVLEEQQLEVALEDGSVRVGDEKAALFSAEDDWIIEPAAEDERQPSAEHQQRQLRDARSHLRFGLRDEAVKCLSALLATDPGHLEGRALLCDLFLSAGHYDGAVAELSRLVARAEEIGDARAAPWRATLAELEKKDDWAFALERMDGPVVTAHTPVADWDEDTENGGSELSDAIRDLVEQGDLETAGPLLWRPRHVDRREADARPARRLYAFLRAARRLLFDDTMQSRLAVAFEESGALPSAPPGQMAMALLLAEAVGASLEEAAELTADSSRWRLVLDHDEPEPLAPPEELAALRAALDEDGLFSEVLARARALADDARLWPTGEPGPEGASAMARLAAATLRRFHSADGRFWEWRLRHPDDWVLRHFGGLRPERNVLHRASCPHLKRRKGSTAGVELVCGPSLVDVEGEAVRLRGEDGYRRCKTCVAEPA